MTNCPPPNSPARPWEVLGGGPAGVELFFPRTVEVHRVHSYMPDVSVTNPAIGDIGYIGQEQTTTPGVGVEGEQILYINVPATIAPKVAGRSKGPLPADQVFKTTWTITIPSSVIPMYGIRDRDILVDDEGYRYSVGAAGYSSLAWSLECIRLEA